MNQRRWAFTILAAAALGGTAVASDIYRYVDEEGNVNYVDRPTGAETEERVAIVSNRSTVSRPADADDSREARAAGESASEDTEAAPKKLTRAERRAAKRERDEKCQTYRDQMETIVSSRRLYREHENGERVYLDESESQAARDQVQGLIEEFCS